MAVLKSSIILECGDYTLIERVCEGFTDYVVAYHYNRETNYWKRASYCPSMESAIETLHYRIKPEHEPSQSVCVPQRLEELASTALSYLYDNDMLDDYLEDRDIELSDRERDLFEVYPTREDEDDWEEEDEYFEDKWIDDWEDNWNEDDED